LFKLKKENHRELRTITREKECAISYDTKYGTKKYVLSIYHQLLEETKRKRKKERLFHREMI